MHILAFFLIDTALWLIEYVSDSFLSYFCFFKDKVFNILSIIEIIQKTSYIITWENLSQSYNNMNIFPNIYYQSKSGKFGKFVWMSITTFNLLVQYLEFQKVFTMI